MELEAAGMARTYTAVLVKDEDGRYSVSVPALPGCHTWGADIGEALMMARDAIEGYLAVLQEDGDPIPEEGGPVLVDMGEAREALVYRLASEEW
jgi:predicted RNase H-like HicB family nuclease